MKYPCQEYALKTLTSQRSLHIKDKWENMCVCKCADFCVKLLSDDKEIREEDKEFIVLKICEQACDFYEVE